MSFTKKIVEFCQQNVAMLSGMTIIIAFHWGWYKLQHVPTLVDQSTRKEIPIITGAKKLAEITQEKIHELTSDSKHE